MNDYIVKPGYFYTTGDTWAKEMPDGSVRFGITDYAQAKLKEIVYLSLPEEGETVEQNESLGEIESQKTVSPLLSPVSGAVLRINETATDAPQLVNREPFDGGWILEIRCVNAKEQFENLLDADGYKALLFEKEGK